MTILHQHQNFIQKIVISNTSFPKKITDTVFNSKI